MFRKNSVVTVLVVAVLCGFFALPLFAANFHINPAADGLSSKEAKNYVGGSVAGVTGSLGSPSMVRDDLANPSLMHYIYIGNGKVCTFMVSKESGKPVTDAKVYSRGEWEGSVYPGYPA